jgi:hypothetical protein
VVITKRDAGEGTECFDEGGEECDEGEGNPCFTPREGTSYGKEEVGGGEKVEEEVSPGETELAKALQGGNGHRALEAFLVDLKKDGEEAAARPDEKEGPKDGFNFFHGSRGGVKQSVAVVLRDFFCDHARTE